jgi:hypothetical protein
MDDQTEIVKVVLTQTCNLGPRGRVMARRRHLARLMVERGVARYLDEPEVKRVASPPRNKAVAKPIGA